MAAPTKSWAELMDELDPEWDTRAAVVPSFGAENTGSAAAAAPVRKMNKTAKHAALMAARANATVAKIAGREVQADDVYKAAKAAFEAAHAGEAALPSFLGIKEATNPEQVRRVIGIKIGKMTSEQKEGVTIEQMIIGYLEEKYKGYVEKVFSKKAKGGALRRRTLRESTRKTRKTTHRKRKTGRKAGRKTRKAARKY
jgi:hypothetical protein